MNSNLITAAGTDGATMGDTKACRVYHGGAPAMLDATAHCPHAGSTGGTACGTLADVYCSQLAAVCGTQATAAECAKIAPVYPVGMHTDTTGNSIYCRLYHLRAGVALNDLTTHCPHTSPHGGGACGLYPDNFCQIVFAACSGTMNPYATMAECLTYAKAYTEGAILTDTALSTLACRMYHARVALALPAAHCAHTGPDGGGACGDKCDAFCDLQKFTCTTQNWPTVAACRTACLAWTAGTTGATSGNTFACRSYHLGVALTTNAATTHCPHTGPSGGSVCVDTAASTQTAGSEKLFALFVMIIFIFI